jgi:hypothetical protein
MAGTRKEGEILLKGDRPGLSIVTINTKVFDFANAADVAAL